MNIRPLKKVLKQFSNFQGCSRVDPFRDFDLVISTYFLNKKHMYTFRVKILIAGNEFSNSLVTRNFTREYISIHLKFWPDVKKV